MKGGAAAGAGQDAGRLGQGLTLDEMADKLSVAATAERMRDAVREAFPQMEEVDDPPTRRFPHPLQVWTASSGAQRRRVRRPARGGRAVRAQGRNWEPRPCSLWRTGPLRLSARARRKLRRTWRPSWRPRPRLSTPAPSLRGRGGAGRGAQAIKSLRRLRFRYLGGVLAGRVREITPFRPAVRACRTTSWPRRGFLEAALWRLDRIRDIEGSPRPGLAAGEAFSLQAFMNRSFGIYQDEVEEVVLRVHLHGAEGDGLALHPTQTVDMQEDGSVLVKFTAAPACASWLAPLHLGRQGADPGPHAAEGDDARGTHQRRWPTASGDSNEAASRATKKRFRRSQERPTSGRSSRSIPLLQSVSRPNHKS